MSQTTVYDTCFAYGDRPDFFDDPFLMSDVDSAQVMTVSDPQRQARAGGSDTGARASGGGRAGVDGGVCGGIA